MGATPAETTSSRPLNMNQNIDLIAAAQLPPEAFVFMKVGQHAGEDFDSILKRKRREIEVAGFCLWGYGGTACHPLQQVQPFVKTRLSRGGRVSVLMQSINSNADPEVLPATQYSADGMNWLDIPEGIVVTGSRYALVLDKLEPGDLLINLEEYQVAVGPSRNTAASDYVRGRVDKGCFERIAGGNVVEAKEASISFIGELVDPYAVMLRSNP